MTTTAQTQADLDAQTYAVYAGNGAGRLSKAEVARQLGINASTVTDRIKRHVARQEQDTLADSRALDAAQAAQDAEYAADSEAAEQASPFVADPANPTDDEISAAIDRGLANGTVIDADEWLARQAPVTEDPDESLVALLEDGEPEAAGQDGYEGPTCPSCDAVAYAFKGGHFTGCRYAKLNAGRPAAVTVNDTVVAMTERVDITGQDDAAEVASTPAAEVTPEPAKAEAEKVLVTECVRCGFRFTRPQARQTCQSDKACQRRQAAKVTT